MAPVGTTRASAASGFRLEQVEHSHQPLIDAFNQRMEAGGSNQRLSTKPSFSKIRRTADSPIGIKSFVALVGDQVRGGVNIKTMPFMVDGERHSVSFYNRPLSEGIVDPKWSMVGTMIQKTAAKRFPLIYGLGVGSKDEPVARLMVASGWSCEEVPFLFKVVRGKALVDNLQMLKASPLRTALAKVASGSGAASVGAAGWAGLQRLRGKSAGTRVKGLEIELIENWDCAASSVDALWQSVTGSQTSGSRGPYRLVGERSARVAHALYPSVEIPSAGEADQIPFQRVLVHQDGNLLGWAVVIVSRLKDHNHFGNAVLGSVVDAFAPPEHASAVLAAAVHTIEKKGCDLIVANFSHSDWVAACEQAGMLRGPTNFLLFLSKPLKGMLAESESDEMPAVSMFFTRGDGDGPANLY